MVRREDSKANRTIMHVDMDAFFAAIEQRENPHLRGQPVIVGGRKTSRRGVVATCSYEARKYGVRSAMPIAQAARLCPHGYFLPARMSLYRAVSRKVHQVFREFSPVVEPISVDEAFLDMTGCEHFYPSLEAMGSAIKKAIYRNTRLTASVGIAPNKFLAKLASDLDKPDGLVIITPDQVDEFLLPLDIRKVWGVGEKTEAKLRSFGIHTVADLRAQSPEWLTRRFGQQGMHLYELSRGIDNRPVYGEAEDAQSIGHETTFPTDIVSVPDLRKALAELAANVGWRLRRNHMYGKTVTVKARYSDFTTLTRSRTLPNSFNDDKTIFHTAWDLFEHTIPRGAFRLLGIYVSHLGQAKQLSLFDTGEDKLTETVDRINLKYGKAIIKRGIFS